MSFINLDSVSKRFEKHVAIEKNYRIIFSGKFGIGKTYFLNHFFDNNSHAYNKFLVSPVNYVVGSNEDIFELIKADIIKQLFYSSKIKLNGGSKNSVIQNFSYYIENNQFSLLQYLTKFIAKINPVVEISEKVMNELVELYKKYKKEVEKRADAERTLDEDLKVYLDDAEQKIGSIYEYNYITKVINSILKDIGTKKKNVLIIDDLDRVDPEHIFRILNVLSAHNDHIDDKNKFGFDHIVLVCDIENIKKIFFYRYGKDVDFDGYIDKFYSTDIFFYTNDEALKYYVSEKLKADERSSVFVIFMLQKLIDFKLLTIRKLLKHSYNQNFEPFTLYRQQGIQANLSFLAEQIGYIKDFKNLFVSSNDFSILGLFRLFTLIFGDFNSFYNCIQILKSDPSRSNYQDIETVVSYLALQFHISKHRSDDLFFYKEINHNEGNFVRYLRPPNCDVFQLNFSIRIAWNASNPYTGDTSYFNNAFAERSENYSSREKDMSIKDSDIFTVVEKIILSCRENKYLEMAGII